MGEMSYQTRHFHRTPRIPCGPSIPSTIAGCEAALKQAQTDVAAARKPLTGAYSPKAYANWKETLASALRREAAVDYQLRFLRGEVELLA